MITKNGYRPEPARTSVATVHHSNFAVALLPPSSLRLRFQLKNSRIRVKSWWFHGKARHIARAIVQPTQNKPNSRIHDAPPQSLADQARRFKFVSRALLTGSRSENEGLVPVEQQQTWRTTLTFLLTIALTMTRRIPRRPRRWQRTG